MGLNIKYDENYFLVFSVSSNPSVVCCIAFSALNSTLFIQDVQCGDMTHSLQSTVFSLAHASVCDTKKRLNVKTFTAGGLVTHTALICVNMYCFTCMLYIVKHFVP